MGVAWAKNLYLPGELSETEMSDIPHPRPELHLHVMYKTVELCSCMGMFLAPGIALFTGRASQILSLTGKYTMRGYLGGIALGPIMTELALNSKKATPESVTDRCYRLRHNRNQVRVDRGATCGEAVGLVAALAMKGSPLLGLAYGLNIGTIGTGIYNNVTGERKDREL